MENKFFNDLIQQTQKKKALVPLGTCFGQNIVLGQPSSLKDSFVFESKSECFLAIMSQQAFERTLNEIESEGLEYKANTLSLTPPFVNWSKKRIRKVVNTFKIQKVYKGWKYESFDSNKDLYFIASGSLLFKKSEN